MKLTTTDHNRDRLGLSYVYPVLSRRSGGLSVGINLNPNNACNWHCIYCQVPNLKRGSAPKIDIEMLKYELDQVLSDVIHGNFFQRFEIEPEYRKISDIAISGNGEATTATNFDEIVETITEIGSGFELFTDSKLVLITNGSMVHRQAVIQGLKTMSNFNGEVWFKLDTVGEASMQRINQVRISEAKLLRNIEQCCQSCSTWIQTCLFSLGPQSGYAGDLKAYLAFMRKLYKRQFPLKGVLLYGLERPSMQVEGRDLAKLSNAEFDEFVTRVESLGWRVRAHY